MIMRYGIYGGKDIKDIPSDYLANIYREAEISMEFIGKELQKRAEAEVKSSD